MTARLVFPLVVTLKDVPSVVLTLPTGASVKFDLAGADPTDVVCEGKVYTAMLHDLLEAAHPMEWVGS
jgi:hypothetical protein